MNKKLLNKKILAGLIASLTASAAFAQTAQSDSNVTIWGNLDVGLYHTAHSYNQDPINAAPANPWPSKFATQSLTGMEPNGLGASFIGFKGSESLGDGLSAVFDLRTYINPNDGVIQNSIGSVGNVGASGSGSTGGDGSAGGQLFNIANVGLSSSAYGTVVFGRNFNLAAAAIAAVDPMQGSAYISPMGYTGRFVGGGFTEDAKFDNSVVYSNKSGPFNYAALYKFGGQAGATSAQSAESFSLGYTSGPLNIQAVVEKDTDAISVGATGPGTVSLKFADTTGYWLGGDYVLDKFTLYTGAELNVVGTPSNPALDAVAYGTYFGMPVTATNMTAFVHEKRETLTWLGVAYQATPNFKLAAAVYNDHQNDYSGGLCATNGQAVATCAGNYQFVSFLADYSFSKRTDVYAGYQFSRATGGDDVVGTLSSADTFIMAGIRLRF